MREKKIELFENTSPFSLGELDRIDKIITELRGATEPKLAVARLELREWVRDAVEHYEAMRNKKDEVF